MIRENDVDEVVFAYSDVTHQEVMHKASIALAAGADFQLLGPRHTQLRSIKPVVAVCAVRTGAGMSPATRRVCSVLSKMGHRVVAVRHPMPYGDLLRQAVQRFADFADLDSSDCTIEEREEYEPLLETGATVFAGVDYEGVLRAAEKEADIIVWDGGNNDMPFFAPDLHIVIADARRPGHESTYHPGEANVRAADVLVINKVDSASPEHVRAVFDGLRALNHRAVVIETASPIEVAEPEAIRGQRVLVIEDGPTVTHGGAPYGAGWLAAQQCGAAGVVDPRPCAVGSIREVFHAYPTIGPILPAMGYGREMIADLEQTINAVRADVVLVGTPIDLGRFLHINKPLVRVRYELKEIGSPTFEDVLQTRFARFPALAAH